MPPKQRQALTDRSNMSLAVEPTTVNPARLKYDYSQIAEEHRERVQFATMAIQDYMNRAAESVIRAGQELLDVKEVLPHGQFGEWLEVEFGMSHRTANNWMNVAKTYGGKFATVANLNASALILLAAPSTPEAARQEVETQAKETGTAPTRKEVRRIIDKHKPPEPKPARVVYTETPASALPTSEPILEGWPDDTGWRYLDSQRADFDATGFKLQYNFAAHREDKPHVRWVRLVDGQAEYGEALGGPKARSEVIEQVLQTLEPKSTNLHPALPDGYTLRQTPRGWRWRRELTNDTVLMGDYCETEAGAVESARRDWEARQARQAARTVYVEPLEQPVTEPNVPTEHFIVTLAAEHYHALRAAILAGALRLSTDRATVEAIKQALEEAERVE